MISLPLIQTKKKKNITNNLTNPEEKLFDSLIYLISRQSGEVVEVLSRLVLYKLYQGKKDLAYVNVCFPNEFMHLFERKLCLKLVIRNESNRVKATLFDLSKASRLSISDDFIVFGNAYYHSYKTPEGSKKFWLFAEGSIDGILLPSKKLFQINLFSDDMPRYVYPSCWGVFVTQSRVIQSRITKRESQTCEHKDLIDYIHLVNIWKIAFDYNGENHHGRGKELCKAADIAPNRYLLSTNGIENSALAMAMFIIYNHDRIESFEKVESQKIEKFEQLFDALVRDYYYAAVIKQTMKSMMRKAFELKLIELKSTDKSWLLKNLLGELSKYFCLLKTYSQEEISRLISYAFQLKNIIEIIELTPIQITKPEDVSIDTVLNNK